MKAAILISSALLLATPAAASPVQQGKHLYGQYCISCHGANGEGVHPAARGRGYGPSLRGVGAQAADFYLRTGYMPLHHLGLQPRRTRVLLTETQIRALVDYVASLEGGPPIPRPHAERGNLAAGLHLFTERCSGCHQVVGEGGYVTGAIPPALGAATPTQIAEAVRIGPYVMPTFSRRSLSDAQLDSIIRYVEYTKHPDDRGGWAIGHIGPIPEGLVTWFVGMAALLGVCLTVGRRLRRD